jgi:hypothetical protein
MNSFRTEPFLWIHLSGLAVLPLCLEFVWLGLSIGDPVLPSVLELGLIAVIGIIPVLWMQWQRPFDIFSLLLVAINPNQLSDEQRKLLKLFKQTRQKVLTAIAPILLLLLLGQLYQFAPIAATATAGFPQIRLLGLFLAAVGFLASNLFLQVPLSVLGVLLTRQETYTNTEAYTPAEVSQNFTIPGIRVGKILPTLITETEG